MGGLHEHGHVMVAWTASTFFVPERSLVKALGVSIQWELSFSNENFAQGPNILASLQKDQLW